MICNILAIKSNVSQAASMSKSGMDSKNLVATAMSASGGHALGFVNQEHSPCFWGLKFVCALMNKARQLNPSPTCYCLCSDSSTSKQDTLCPTTSHFCLHTAHLPSSSISEHTNGIPINSAAVYQWRKPQIAQPNETYAWSDLGILKSWTGMSLLSTNAHSVHAIQQTVSFYVTEPACIKTCQKSTMQTSFPC